MSKKPALTTTPPESFVNLPLTPPATDTKPSSDPSDRVSRITTHLRLRKAGCRNSDSPWTAFQLLSGDFEQLFAVLKADESLWGFVEDKVRYDYFWRSSCFVLRMPTTTHESFRSSVVVEIQGQLSRIASGKDEAAEFAKSVQYNGSPRLRFPADEEIEDDIGGGAGDEETKTMSKYDSHEPDAVFKHRDAHWPGIVIEVSFSQKERMLKDLAEDYILGSNGNIRAVVGLDIEYKQSRKATLSVWRPQFIENEDGQMDLVCTQTILDQEFRDTFGNPIGDASAGLKLQLRDFAPDIPIKNPETMNQRIFISSSALSNFVTRAEVDAKQSKDGQGVAIPLKPGTRKRRRQKTPPEELQSDDERRFLEEEERATKRTAKQDGDYVRSSPSTDDKG